MSYQMLGLTSIDDSHPYFAVFGEDERAVHHGLHSETPSEMEEYCKKYLPIGASVKVYKRGEDGDTLVSEFTVLG